MHNVTDLLIWIDTGILLLLLLVVLLRGRV
jgi:hypothetical protein